MSIRDNTLYEYNGKYKTAAEWALTCGMSQQLMRYRLKCKGMTVKEAIETPVINRGQGRKEKGTEYTPKKELRRTKRLPKGCTYPDCEYCPFPDCYY